MAALTKKQIEDTAFNTLKAALSMGGGVVGAGLGTPIGLGPGSPLTALAGGTAGSALGYGAGEGLENLYKTYNNEPVDVLAPIKALPVGAAQELGGQMIGKGLGYVAGKIIDKARPTSDAVKELVNQLKRNPEGNLAIEYHGSTIPVAEPIAKAITGLGGDTFHTTPNKGLAEFFAAARKLRDQEFIGQPGVINEYYLREVPEARIDFDTVSDIGDKLGLSKEAIETAIQKAGKEPFKLYSELLKQRLLSQSVEELPVSLRDIGANAAEALKNHGIRRFVKPVDLGGMETLNWHPQEDLFYKPLLDSKIQQELTGNAANRQGKESTQLLIDLLSKAVARSKGVD